MFVRCRHLQDSALRFGCRPLETQMLDVSETFLFCPCLEDYKVGSLGQDEKRREGLVRCEKYLRKGWYSAVSLMSFFGWVNSKTCTKSLVLLKLMYYRQFKQIRHLWYKPQTLRSLCKACPTRIFPLINSATLVWATRKSLAEEQKKKVPNYLVDVSIHLQERRIKNVERFKKKVRKWWK